MDSSQARLKELFKYEDGQLIWLPHSKNGRKNSFVGKSAGSICKDGRIYVRVENNLQRRSRLVWIWHNGSIEIGLVIDHKDRQHTNDRIENLRKCTQKQNTRNRTTTSRSNTGIKGISYCKRDNAFYVHVGSKFHSYHKTLEEAVKARVLAAENLYGEFANELPCLHR